MVLMLITRVIQFLFAATVLALSVVLLKDYGPGKAPALEGYAAFCGGAGLLINIIGFAAIYFDFLQGLIMLVLDAVAAFFTLAGGIAIAVTIRIGSCTDIIYLGNHGNSFVVGDYKLAYGFNGSQRKALDSLIYRCRMTQANVAILWLLFGTFLATVVLHFVSGRSAGRGMKY